MTLETLDPRTALIVVDLQAGTLGNPTVHPADQIVANAVELLSAFRAHRLPVVLANVNGTPAGRTDVGGGAREFPEAWSELVPELDRQTEDLTVTRRSWDVFTGTGLEAQLAQLEVTQVVILGVATSFGVESTARHAYDLGLNVVIAADAITDLRAEAHEHSVTRVFPILGQLASTAEIVAQLDAR